MVTDLPKYMSDVLRFSITENGLYSALPYLLMWIVSITTGFLSDWLIVKKYLNLTNARKVFTAVGKLFTASIYLISVNALISFSRCWPCHFHHCCFLRWVWPSRCRCYVYLGHGFYGYFLSGNEGQSTGSESKLCRYIDGNYKRYWGFNWHYCTHYCRRYDT